MWMNDFASAFSDKCECLVLTRRQWLRERGKRIGGSDVAAIMGLSPFDGATPYKIWAEKVGVVEPTDIGDIPAVEWGSRLESVIAEKFKDNHPLWSITLNDPRHMTVFVDREHPWAMATLDGLICGASDRRKPIAILEIKTAHHYSADLWGESGGGAAGVPIYYLTQVYQYMRVTGLRKAFVAVLIDGMDYREYEIDYDDEEVQAVAEAVDKFWNEHIVPNEPPEATVVDAPIFAKAHKGNDEYDMGDTEDLMKVEEYRELKEKADAYKDAVAKAGFTLKQRIGDSHGLLFDEGRLTWARHECKKVDRKAMEEDDPMICAAYRDLEEQHTTKVTRDYGLRWKDAK